MKQYDLIKDWISEHGSILPAKMAGTVYKETMFGSETSKRCRELRAKGILHSVKDGKFEKFFMVEPMVDSLQSSDNVVDVREQHLEEMKLGVVAGNIYNKELNEFIEQTEKLNL